MKVHDITTWQAFDGVATHGGFTAAASALRLSVPQLSKHVSRLEQQLGARLFKRSTRSVILTDEGKSLLPKVRSMLEDLRQLESSFEGGQLLAGTIRVTSVPFLAHRLLLPVISSFTRKHPEVRIELDLSETMVNLVETNTDLAIRIDDQPEDSSLVYRKLAPNRLVLCASPAYLKRCKAPLRTPEDLRAHEILMLDLHRNCRFRKTSARLSSVARPAAVHSENGWILTELALQGSGVLVRSMWDVEEHLRSGRLVQVLKNHPIEDFGDIYAVLPHRRLLAARVRAFVDAVTQESARAR